MMRTKVAIQHTDTLVANIGNSGNPVQFEVLETETGTRTLTGASQTTKDSASTAEVVNIGDTVKYINLFIQAGPRQAGTGADDRTGWLEWAFLMNKESDTVIPTTQLGTQTLGDVATKMYRNECIYTGCMTIGNNQPSYLPIILKVPRFKQHIRIGDEWSLYVKFRSVLSTSVDTDAVRVILSFMYKTYS